jgi:hypothetical protein
MTSAEAEPAVTQTQPSSLTSLLAMQESPTGSPVEYVIGGLHLSGVDRDVAARQLADDAMRIRCGRSSTLDAWRARRDGGPPSERKRIVETYAGIGFGLPDDPANGDHLQGLVAELVWNRLIQERRVCRDGRRLVRAHPVRLEYWVWLCDL